MALLSDTLKKCGVKINTIVSGVPSFGSGVVYTTPSAYDYNYVLTAKHLLQEDSRTPYDEKKLFSVEILHSDIGVLRRLDYLKKHDFPDRLITFDDDFVIILVKKSEYYKPPQIMISDKFDDSGKDFLAWGTFSANENELHRFDLTHNDSEMKRFKSAGNLQGKYLPGLSGAGVFNGSRSVLHGIIKSYPNDEFQNETIDCARISFADVNSKLKFLGKVEMDSESSPKKRHINQDVIYIHEAPINGVLIDLDLARRRLKHDIEDDWFHDPLKYIDLLNEDYLFKQFQSFFGNETYKSSLAERFFVPKKQFTLRQAMVSPFVDRIMYMASVSVLAKRLDEAMHQNVYSARYNAYSKDQLILNGVEQWKKMKYRLSDCANQKDHFGNFLYGCVIEIDLLNFYDNIDKKLLHEKVKRVCISPNEKRAAELLHEILLGFSHKDLGLPQNSDASSLLASFYLNQVDTFMIHHVPEYFRFMDDIRIFCKDKYEARKILQTFEFELRRCHLSVNSQKTRIISFQIDPLLDGSTNENRALYDIKFDLELNKISQMRKSGNYAYQNEAFHQCVTILSQGISISESGMLEDAGRRVNYALNTVALLARKGLNIGQPESDFEKALLVSVDNLKDEPWITSQICKVLNLIPTDEFKRVYFQKLAPLVLNPDYNIYAFQTYQLWLLFAKHKCSAPELTKYAVENIEKNDNTNKPVIGAMVIYMCSVDVAYRRVILRKFGEDFTNQYFQNRLALISLRAFDNSMVDQTKVNTTLEHAHEFTHKYSHRDLVFVSGFEEEEDAEEIDQLYSL